MLPFLLTASQLLAELPDFSTTSHLIGNLPDGTPPPPEPPKPGFVVPARDILNTTVHQQGGRKITVNEIKPIPLPPPAAPAPPDLNNPAVQARIAALDEDQLQEILLRLGSIVYHPKDSAPRSLVTFWPDGEQQSVTLWSSADFSLLSGVSSFLGSNGETYSMLMAWSSLDIESTAASYDKRDSPYQPPQIPNFPAGKATFIITSENPSAQAIATLQALHDLYNNEHDRLLAAYQGRERARLAQEAELKAHPPKPKDITLNYWRIPPPAPGSNTKGATR